MPLWKIVGGSSKIKNRNTISIPLLGTYLKEIKLHLEQISLLPFNGLFIIAKVWGQSQYPSAEEWIKKNKENVVYIYNVYTYSIPICSMTKTR